LIDHHSNDENSHPKCIKKISRKKIMIDERRNFKYLIEDTLIKDLWLTGILNFVERDSRKKGQCEAGNC